MDILPSLEQTAKKAAEDAQKQFNALGLKVVSPETTEPKSEPTPEPKDLTDRINRMELRVRKKHAESITQLERDESKKRRKEAVDAHNAERRELLEIYSRNKRMLENEAESLTAAQIEQINTAQTLIGEIIYNNQTQLQHDLHQLDLDAQAAELEILNETINLRLEAVKKGSDEEFELRRKAIENERKLALIANQKLPEGQRQSEGDINMAYASRTVGLVTEYAQYDFEQQQALEEARFDAVQHSEKQITRFKLQQEKERWQWQISLAEAGALDWSQAQIDAAKEAIKGIDRQLSELEGFKGYMSSLGENGLGGSILETMGFDDDAISAFGSAVDTVVGYLQEIADAEVELAEKAVEAAEERVSAAQSAYDAEIEARNNGYANNVATAKKELEQEKKKQQQKQKLLEQAQKRQEALNTIMQTGSLITASANLWSSFSSVPIIGPILAATAIAAMWASFATAKVKARQATSGSEAYGEGGLEFLEGGSHASGNDINLGARNKKGKRMRAEGGEALAIISKKQTRKYRKVLPDVIDSLNKGTFEDKYLNAFGGPGGLNISLNSDSNIDLSKIETDVRDIKKQNETRYYTLPDGTIIVQQRNIKRVIKN